MKIQINDIFRWWFILKFSIIQWLWVKQSNFFWKRYILFIEFIIKVTFIKVTDLWKWLLKVYNNMEHKGNHLHKLSTQIQKEVLFLLIWLHILFRLRFCLQRFVVSLCTTYPTVVAFMVRKIISLNYNFSILSQVGLIKLTVYLSICYLKWIGTPPYRLYRLYRYSQILKTAHYHWW